MWGSGFITAITERDPKVPQWELEALRSPLGGAGPLYCSHGHLDGTPLIISAPTVTPNRVQPVSWSPSGGTWAVSIGGDDASRAIQGCPRGTVVGLYLTLRGLRERVALGIVRNITGSSQGYRIECQHLTSGLTGRLTTSSTNIGLFNDLDSGATTVAGGGYTAADPTIVLADASGLDKDTGAGGLYCVLVTGDSGAQFYVTGTLSVNTITITKAGAFGTTDENAAALNAVAAVAYISGHPYDIARKILISGSGGSVWDTLPDSWGLAMDGSWFAHGDIAEWRDEVVKADAGNYVWDVVVTAQQDNAYGWLKGLLSLQGSWITIRQGSIVFRSPQDPHDARLTTGDELTSRALLRGARPAWDWQYQAQEFTAEYGGCRVTTAAGNTLKVNVRTQSYPALDEKGYDQSSLVFANESAMRGADAARLKEWTNNPPEGFTLNCRGWGPSVWAEGDIIALNIPELRGRLTEAGQSYENHHATILEVAPNWAGDDTRIRLLPAREGS